MKCHLSVFFGIILAVNIQPATAQTTGQASGYIMYSPLQETTTYLIDPDGNTHHTWNCSKGPASTAHLLPDGSIMRPYKVSNPTMNGGATGGGMQRIDWDGNVLWDFTWVEENHQQHHECIPIEQADGSYNALIIAWERKSNAEAIQAGRQDVEDEMWPTEIVEIAPDGSNGGIVVWEWHFWDHLCQDVDPTKDNYYVDGCNNHPELFDINEGNISSGGPFGGSGGDWIHANGMDYSPELDQIVFSAHKTDEIYVIDRSTTTVEAASHEGGDANVGGDFLYRWGNPQNYGAGTEDDQILYVVHGANFIDPGYPGEGNIMVFNNGDREGNANDYSSVEEITPPLSGSNYALPWNQEQTWIYSNGATFYANHLSGAFRLPNGNTLASEGTSCRMTEVNTDGDIVFQHTHAGGGNIAKATFYPATYEGLIDLHVSAEEVTEQFVRIFPNPAQNQLTIEAEIGAQIKMLDITGRTVFQQKQQTLKDVIDIKICSKGVYFVEVRTEQMSTTNKIIIQ